MDVRSYLKSVSLSKLFEFQDLVRDELKSRSSTEDQMDTVVTFSDGAARGNPGPAGAGALVLDEKGNRIVEDCLYLGECTNNEAEYRALILVLDHALKLTRNQVKCFMDSELLVRQLNGQYALKSEKLKPFFEQVKDRCGSFDKISFTHVPREHPNLRVVDKLANKAIDEKMASSSRPRSRSDREPGSSENG